MADTPPVIWWIRRDLRLHDNPALKTALEHGAPVIPLYILDAQDEALGAAAKFRLGLGLAHFARTLEGIGSRLILRRGAALQVLKDLTQEIGAGHVVWSRLYDPEATTRDTQIKDALKASDITAKSTGGRLLFEPWTVETKAGGPFKVYTPFWKTVRTRDVAPLIPPPSRLPAPAQWPASDNLADYAMDAAMNRGADVLAPHCRVGEQAALDQLALFLDSRVGAYATKRDIPAADATSELSENLAWGEISPHRIWHLGMQALEGGGAGAEHFLKELVWREFAYHLMFHTPHILTRNWRTEWDDFGWREEPGEDLLRWQQGQTGYDFVDAAMRELYVTGKMHNRARMVVASFLTKHLMIHWKYGMQWFADCLVDWDPAANAMGWQWVAGCGPDAAPFFRIFNPDGQRQKFDPDQRYTRRWLAEGQAQPPQTALDFYRAIPRSWPLTPDMMRALPVIDLKAGRERALEAYAQRKTQ
ncbi:deoxyribodipyrimidine photo-lyase [Phaeobacter sp. HF9A]|uniref:cryptochrome/photolyase family protein n=1 Tax=Phaeobacter sp. HF9A TaxID=2721561 RepID=UPI0014304749|nr:deoxyribodipyrimidine photo-lyase [Phaeobacter sp. HF9A]NIZ13883.1 deoxyribodipyrimidine photo-lyase [Phaeobacter sp. HF9A]